ncbi:MULTISPECIES: MarR family winged helix-turn-helix transcriptional regulator [Paenibacillus]|uniref:DNA-binding transcriptional regulator, MarR family n=3 Tax=Paenibacillus TaxID=44249 RepID=A0A1H8FT64_9BACL|nr:MULTISPECIES: MarR family transcriptional regulator [Paenibacillus]AHV97644.1 MarR family transcriptional regulator [Paenibacillus sabinae T27]QWU13969.1 MarR family transcriptional regulator [Paenibacillus sophorae]RQW13343.1 MarR family transcriptional regulator [Paenibacillus rhizophilus]SEN34735.1 DNA-binding transcriptional regulator, MarR family [Paenibacillus sophorae]
MNDSSERLEAINQLNRAIYTLLTVDGRLRGRATQIPGALSTPHARALKSLTDNGNLSIKELSLHTENRSSAVTQLVDGLEKNGYVERIRSTADRRTVTVSITPKGLEVFQERDAKIKKMQEEELTVFTPEEINTASEIIRRMSKIIDQL